MNYYIYPVQIVMSTIEIHCVHVQIDDVDGIMYAKFL